MTNPANPAIFLPFPLLCLILFYIPKTSTAPSAKQPYRFIGEIPPPSGYNRETAQPGSFSLWLRKIPLREDPTVYLYDGRPKQNQQAQVAVLDIPVGDKNLQQCADACMRLRAEYLLAAGKVSEIEFEDNLSRSYRLGNYRGRRDFEKYMENVFSWCGTLSLEKQMNRINGDSMILPGDVIIVGGSPGHAVMVVDMAVDNRNNRLYLLAQSYMPAQQIHVLRNPSDPGKSPWYRIKAGETIRTPEWTFEKAIIKRW